MYVSLLQLCAWGGAGGYVKHITQIGSLHTNYYLSVFNIYSLTYSLTM